MFFKYFLICCLFQQLLADWLSDDCILAESHTELLARNRLYDAKEACDITDNGKCYGATGNDQSESEACVAYNNCLKEVLDVYQFSIKDYEYATNLFTESITEVCNECNGFLKYAKVFHNLFQLHLMCEYKYYIDKAKLQHNM
ncbi:uncharacterized protein LOC119605780 [Lucilia sericata]|uniref:uncharacterized protein LOC119605780 n=1 Tax=Lucilia sericata TaxID=13632 RepID=UPI0018A7EE58|nr:uncharacterized protein LOC119605780 [Lucilia sericata]